MNKLGDFALIIILFAMRRETLINDRSKVGYVLYLVRIIDDISSRISHRLVPYFSATVNPIGTIRIRCSHRQYRSHFHTCLFPLFIFLFCLSLFICFLIYSSRLISLRLSHRYAYLYRYIHIVHMYIYVHCLGFCSTSFLLFFFSSHFFFWSHYYDP